MKRPDPQMVRKAGAEDVEAMKNRVAWMEALFFLDGRDLKSHPMYGTFTGLAHKYNHLTDTEG